MGNATQPESSDNTENPSNGILFMNPMSGKCFLFINMTSYQYDDLASKQLHKNADEEYPNDEWFEIFDILPAFDNLDDTDYIVYGDIDAKEIFGIYPYIESTEINETALDIIVSILPISKDHFHFVNKNKRYSVVRMGNRIRTIDDLFFRGKDMDDYPVQWNYEKANAVYYAA